ncbi:MAG TPA: sigma-70 family RNA polymerase sigma factor [Candidatus Polarisedimenticolia bacterium]|jgi:RNA polymerase sigma-70 factor (ECF subfamily)|nr:sigma-70 family RNA polymerase sigma factor [Candidatus Polarisedimenticolia bacterium]
MNLSGEPGHPTGEAAATGASIPSAAPDTEGVDRDLVARARKGETEAFEALFRLHHRAVYRTLLGITGRPEDAEDAVQTAFLKAFQHLDQFQGASRFSTWLTRIAINEGLGRMRQHGRLESLDVEDEEGEFMPRNVRAWDDDPEALRSRAQARELVEREILKLPAKYRIAVVLRDIQQLPAEEAAQILGLGVPTLKTHLLRGRLQLREALAPHFAPRRTPAPAPEGRGR